MMLSGFTVERKGIKETGSIGLTEFNSRCILIEESLHPDERVATLCHELVHVYLERWGLHNVFTEEQREFLAQFFGTVMKEVAVDQGREFRKVVALMKEG